MTAIGWLRSLIAVPAALSTLDIARVKSSQRPNIPYSKRFVNFSRFEDFDSIVRRLSSTEMANLDSFSNSSRPSFVAS